MAKAAQQVLISPEEKEEILAFAIIRQESQAEIVRRLVDIALPQLKRAHESQLAELRAALAGMKVDVSEALADMAEVKLRDDGTRRRLTVRDLKTATGAWRARYAFGAAEAPRKRPTRA